MEKYADLKPKNSPDQFSEYFVKYRIGAKTDGIVILAKTAKDAVLKLIETFGTNAEFELLDLRKL